ncbi:MAG: response regulator [Chloroflexota bacterium]
MVEQKHIKPAEILLVEDNPGDVRLTIEAFKESQIKTNLNVIYDGEEAIKYLQRSGKYSGASQPDFILLDLNLPRKNGNEVLNEIKNDPILKTIPVVILSTSTNIDDIIQSYEGHANCYIAKPVDFGNYITVIKSIENFWFNTVNLPSKAN